MSALTLYAGPVARDRILQEGINADSFRVLLGASGGPKWFVLYGLDRYLFGEFFNGRELPLKTLGSSAGAWRLSCLATADPLKALDELAERYANETYSAQPTTQEITEKMRGLLKGVMGVSGIEELVNNPVIQTHIVADRCRGFGSSTSTALRKLFLGSSAISNVFSRSSLSWFFERAIFSSSYSDDSWNSPDKIQTKLIDLTQGNCLDALLATGSIPFVLDGVRDIEGSSKGLYLDGGITDYHFDFKFAEDDELVLYPHFCPAVIPGWFDKFLPWRKIHDKNFSNVLFLIPSEEFVTSLPNSKIPDRNDFANYAEADRLNIWHEVIRRSGELAEDFAEVVSGPVSPDRIRDIGELHR